MSIGANSFEVKRDGILPSTHPFSNLFNPLPTFLQESCLQNDPIMCRVGRRTQLTQLKSRLASSGSTRIC